MTPLMPSDLFLYAAHLRNGFQYAIARAITWYVKHTSIVAQPSVLLVNSKRDGQQFHILGYTCLLTVGVNPQTTIHRVLDNVLFAKILQVNVCQTCECAEDEQVSDKCTLGVQTGEIHHGL